MIPEHVYAVIAEVHVLLGNRHSAVQRWLLAPCALSLALCVVVWSVISGLVRMDVRLPKAFIQAAGTMCKRDFIRGLACLLAPDVTLKASSHVAVPHSQANHCLLLRQSSSSWRPGWEREGSETSIDDRKVCPVQSPLSGGRA